MRTLTDNEINQVSGGVGISALNNALNDLSVSVSKVAVSPTTTVAVPVTVSKNTVAVPVLS